MRELTHQELLDLVDGAAVFSAGGGGDPEVGYAIADRLEEEGRDVQLIDPFEVPDDAVVVNFASVGATSTIEYDSDSAVKTLQALEDYVGKKAYAVIPVELGGFNTLAAVDVAARHGVPVVDADGAGRAVPEVHLKVYTIDDIPLAPMAVADSHAKNIVIVKATADFRAAERIARTLAAEWNQSVYTARRILTGRQVKFSPVLHTLSMSTEIGQLLREVINPVDAVVQKTGGFRLFDGRVSDVKKETKGGFTWMDISLEGLEAHRGSTCVLEVKNETLAAYKDRRLIAIAPDIITPTNPETGKCITAEKIEKNDKLAVLGLRAPEKWRTTKGLELWKDVLQRSGIDEKYVPIEQLVRQRT